MSGRLNPSENNRFKRDFLPASSEFLKGHPVFPGGLADFLRINFDAHRGGSNRPTALVVPGLPV